MFSPLADNDLALKNFDIDHFLPQPQITLAFFYEFTLELFRHYWF